MGPLNKETNQTPSAMEPEHGKSTLGALKMHPDSSGNGVDLSTSSKKLRSWSSKSSSSSPDSPFDDPFQDDYYEIDESGPTKLHDYAQLASKPKDAQSNHEFPVSTLPPAGDSPQLSSHKAAATESPSIQSMERLGDTSYRIPSSVFARTKSTTPVEWSVASNESLFSIHTGIMSFTRDTMLWRSGELGLPGESTTSAQMFHFSHNQAPVSGMSDMGKSSEGNVAEAAVETMKEVIRESAEEKRNKKLSLGPCVSSRSDASGASTKSFAFPILIGDIRKCGSLSRSCSQRLGAEHSQPQMPTQSHQQPQPQPKAKDPQPPVPQTKWPACFLCCTSCS